MSILDTHYFVIYTLLIIYYGGLLWVEYQLLLWVIAVRDVATNGYPVILTKSQRYAQNAKVHIGIHQRKRHQ